MDDIDTLVRELEEASSYEETDCGEGWSGLCSAWHSCYGCSDEFRYALEQEIREQHAWMTNHFTWVECNHSECSHCGRGGGSYKELIWNDEL